ncbi:hypothetical protein PINS_up007036 [Pythium insidiosum]|nr:hypothetical protein PINS_up007036 [Pythium insidiosum]
MVFRRSLPLLLAAAALATSMTEAQQGYTVKFTNKCDHQIDLFDPKINPGGTEPIEVGKSVSKFIQANTGARTFRHSKDAQATLAEFSGDNGMAWYDISIIPTGPKSGPDYCGSLQECKAYTGGKGFNVPMDIVPNQQNGGRCRKLECPFDGCTDAYLFPKDDLKTHVCPLGTEFEVIFCPGGRGAPPGAGLMVVGIIGAVAVVAGAAIYTVRKKQAELDEMEQKTPVEMLSTVGGQSMMQTPREMINVL